MSSRRILPSMTLLDVVHRYPATQAVFRSKNEQAGECILCKALFETITTMACRYGLDLEELLVDLEQAANEACAR